jgi:hypothetical protein
MKSTGDIMKTALVDGQQVCRFDALMLCSLRLVPCPVPTVSSESIVIGLRNEHGNIYRIIGVRHLNNFMHIIWKLRALGWAEVVPSTKEVRQGFHAVVRPPA